MSDPAIEAATRAMQAVYGYPDPNWDMRVAAREALKPIRELHTKWEVWSRTADQYNAVAGVHNLLDELYKLIYPTTEEEVK